MTLNKVYKLPLIDYNISDVTLAERYILDLLKKKKKKKKPILLQQPIQYYSPRLPSFSFLRFLP